VRDAFPGRLTQGAAATSTQVLAVVHAPGSLKGVPPGDGKLCVNGGTIRNEFSDKSRAWIRIDPTSSTAGTLRYTGHGTGAGIGTDFPADQNALPGQEFPMEVAALVLFSSIALWFAGELSGNQL
jgi:hypothetical protein